MMECLALFCKQNLFSQVVVQKCLLRKILTFDLNHTMVRAYRCFCPFCDAFTSSSFIKHDSGHFKFVCQRKRGETCLFLTTATITLVSVSLRKKCAAQTRVLSSDLRLTLCQYYEVSCQGHLT